MTSIVTKERGAPIRFIYTAVDPQSKQMRGDSFAVFDLIALGVTSLEGADVSHSSSIRLPNTTEPGCVYALVLSPHGGVILEDYDERLPSLLDPPLVLITDELTVKLL